MSKFTQTQISYAWNRINWEREQYRKEYGPWLEIRALFKLGLITHQDYQIVKSDVYKGRWYKSHLGHWYKRRLSKARRRAWKTGKEPVKIESDCNWKGT